ncbi:MAG TPA: 6-bladed beta-propeller, partial [Candidatus Dojkabacteria bacterium]|nr:6-bladed beta-propeller [Candidatus Dojkabacteria bacterium]
IDDNFAIRQIIKIFLARLSRKYTFDLKIFSSDNGVEGLGFVFITDPNIIIVDTTLPKYSGKDILEFFVQNRKFKSKEVTVIVLEERTDRTLNLPNYFIRINKNHPRAFDKLTDVLVEKLNISDFGRMSKFYDYVGGKVMNFSNKDDLLERKLEGKFKLSNILHRFKWAIQEIFISTSLSLIMLFFGKAKDDNITQSKLDNKIFRTKYYPTLALSFVSALFILINITLFTFSQFSLFQNLNKELQAAITDPPTYLVNLPDTDFSTGGYYAQLSEPLGIAVDSTGDIYIADTGLDRIQKFNSDGTKETEWGSYGTGNGQFNNPREIAIDSLENVYVTDESNKRVQKFSSDGTYITQWGTPGTGNGQFDFLDGLEISTSDVIYVADNGNNRIQYFDTSGNYLGKWGTLGTGNGQFDGPTAIAIDSTGNVYVTEEFNHRVQKFSSTGTYITKWGSNGSGDGQFYLPQGIGLTSSDEVYVMDTYNNRVQIFNTSGTYISQYGAYGNENGNFNLPFSVDFDSSGNIYIVEFMNHRFQKFNSSDVYQTKWWGSSGNQDGQYRGPRGIGISSTGNTYVADAGNRRIQKFDVSGVHSISWGDFGTGNGEFYQPSGVAVDSLGNVYTTETNNN